MSDARLLAFIASIAYAVVLHVVYLVVISPVFASEGLVYTPSSDLAVAVGGIAAILPSLWLPVRLRRPSDVVVWLIFLVGYVPASLVLYYVQDTDLFEVLPFTLAMLGGMAVLGVMGALPRASWVVPVNLTHRHYATMLVLASLAAMGYMALTTGISLDLPGLLDVYDTRATFGDTVGATGSGIAYVLVWGANVVAPLLIAIGLRRLRLHLAVVGVILELLIYSVTGFKSAFFASILVVGLVALFALRPTPRAAWLPSLAGLFIALIVMYDQASRSIVATSILVRRLLDVPALVTVRYFDYFSQHDTYGLSHSFLRFWLRPPADLSPPELVGSAYFEPTTWANGGIWADAYANFGLVGIIVFSAGLGLVLWFLDVAADRTDLAITGSVVAVVAVILTNTGLFTAVGSHGLGLLIVAYAFLPRERLPRPMTRQPAIDVRGRADRPQRFPAMVPRRGAG